jgi:hypothetical protein
MVAMPVSDITAAIAVRWTGHKFKKRKKKNPILWSLPFCLKKARQENNLISAVQTRRHNMPLMSAQLGLDNNLLAYTQYE